MRAVKMRLGNTGVSVAGFRFRLRLHCKDPLPGSAWLKKRDSANLLLCHEVATETAGYFWIFLEQDNSGAHATSSIPWMLQGKQKDFPEPVAKIPQDYFGKERSMQNCAWAALSTDPRVPMILG